MPVVAVPAVAAAFAALLALAILWGVQAFARAFAGFIPKGLPLLGDRLHNIVLAIAATAEVAVQWIMADLIRPIINVIVGPVYAVINFVDSLYGLARTTATSWEWLLNSAIPAVISKLEHYAAALVAAARTYAHALYVAAEHYAQRIVAAVRSYAHSLYVAAEHYARRIVDTLDSALRASIAAVQTYAHDLYAASEHYAQRIVNTLRADLTQQIKAVEAELSTVAGVSTAFVATAVADGVKAAESAAEDAITAAITVVDVDGVKALDTIWTGVIDGATTLEGVIATDLPAIGEAVRAIPRAIPTDIADSLAITGAVSIAALRYMRECGVPNCRNLGGVGRALRELFGLVEDGLLIGLLADLIADPQDTAHLIYDGLGGLAEDAIGAAKSTLGV